LKSFFNKLIKEGVGFIEFLIFSVDN